MIFRCAASVKMIFIKNLKQQTGLHHMTEKVKIALVPTMGALHEGHLALGKIAREKADHVIYSIFVNPTQFAEGEDFETYPRNVEDDIEKLEGIADYIYTPTVKDIYPNGAEVTHKAGSAAQGLETNFRPHFFDGVVTVVNKLFKDTLPDIAIFGEKDYQQLQVIREMGFKNDDSGKTIEIFGAPTIREEDGLAMSSRNAYLNKFERKMAAKLYEVISSNADIEAMKTKLSVLGFKVDYVEKRWDRILAAVWLGSTRLIDNVAIK